MKEQTRRFDDKLEDTVLMRYKETGNDYRYFPEPDIPFVVLTDEMIDHALSSLQLTPDERREIYKSKGIQEINIEKLIANRTLSDYLNTYLDTELDFVIASNLLLGDILSYLHKNFIQLEQTKLTKEKFLDLVLKIKNGDLSNKNVKDILEDVLSTDASVSEIMQQKNIQNIKDSSVVLDIIQKVVTENPESVKDYQEGKDRAVKYLMGQVMKEAKGSINPKLASELLLEFLKNTSN